MAVSIGIYFQLLGDVFVIPRMSKVDVRVVSQSLRLGLITLANTLINLDILETKSSSFSIH